MLLSRKWVPCLAGLWRSFTLSRTSPFHAWFSFWPEGNGQIIRKTTTELLVHKTVPMRMAMKKHGKSPNGPVANCRGEISPPLPFRKFPIPSPAGDCHFQEVTILVALKGLSWAKTLGNWAAPTFILPGRQWPKSYSVSKSSLYFLDPPFLSYMWMDSKTLWARGSPYWWIWLGVLSGMIALTVTLGMEDYF